MPRVSKVGPGTETGKMILNDFKNWRVTGFRPWGKNVGSVAHWKTQKAYQEVSENAFRSQARKIAKIAKEQMPAEDVQEDYMSEEDLEGGKNTTTTKTKKMMASPYPASMTILKKRIHRSGSWML